MPKPSRNDRYLNNPNLPTAQAQFEYTPEMVSELKKCKDNVLHFAENYFHIISVDDGRQKIPLHTYQRKALRMIRDNRFNLLLFSRQSGKCLKDSTLCKIRDKNTGEIQEISIKQIFDISTIEKDWIMP
jgi:hypothetical protein